MAFELLQKHAGRNTMLSPTEIEMAVRKTYITFSRKAVQYISFKSDGMFVRKFVEIRYDKDNNLINFKKTDNHFTGYVLQNKSYLNTRTIQRIVSELIQGIYIGTYDAKDDSITFDLNKPIPEQRLIPARS